MSNIDIDLESLDWQPLFPVPPELKEKGWIYKDIPWMDIAFYDKFIEVIGPDNLQLIDGSTMEKPRGNPVARRGQFFVAPDGVKNAQEYANKNRKESE